MDLHASKLGVEEGYRLAFFRRPGSILTIRAKIGGAWPSPSCGSGPMPRLSDPKGSLCDTHNVLLRALLSHISAAGLKGDSARLGESSRAT